MLVPGIPLPERSQKEYGLSFLVELEIVKIGKNSYFSCNTYLYIKYLTSATCGISKPLGVDTTL